MSTGNEHAEHTELRLPATAVLDGDSSAMATGSSGRWARVQFQIRTSANAWWWPCTVLQAIVSVILAVVLCAGAVLILLEVLGRSANISSLRFPWFSEAGVLMLNIICFLGGAVGYRHNRFACLDVVTAHLSKRAQRNVDGGRDSYVLIFSILLTGVGWQFAAQSSDQLDQYLNISMFWMNVALPVGSALLALFALEKILLTSRRAYVGLAGGAAAFVLLYVVHLTIFINGSYETANIVLVSVLTLALIIFGMPLPFSFGTSGIIYCYLGGLPFSTVPGDMLDGLSSFLLVAIPFFMLTGFLMSAAGLSERLGDTLRMLLNRVPGGVLHAIILSMLVFSGISGSKIGDMAALAKTSVRMAEQEDYEIPEAIAALSAGSAMGDTVPPAVGLIVLSSVSALSVGSLFMGGLLPAAATMLALLVIIYFRFRRKPRVPVAGTLGEKVRVLSSAVPLLAIPVILIGGIVTGIATPTEISAISVLVTLVFAMLLYRSLGWRRVFEVAVDTGILAGVILLIVATATLFARVLTLGDIPQELGNLVTSNDLGGRWGFLIISIAVLVVMGMLMEGLPSLLIFAPLLIPLATQVGINPLQYGIIVVMAIGIGTHTPPMGIALYVGAQLGDVPMRSVCRRIVPYMPALYAGIIAVALIPGLVTWIPDALHIS